MTRLPFFLAAPLRGVPLALALWLPQSPAAAQSSLTIGGKIDLGVGKPIGSADKQLMDGAGSRLTLRGEEPLGGGWSAAFVLEHRFSPDVGTQTDPARFWQGQSVLGLRGPYGALMLGRQYTAAYSLAQNVVDPWGGDTVAQLRSAWRGGISRTRVSDSLRYDFTHGGLRLAVSIAEASQEGSNAGPDKPLSAGLNYAHGPWMVAFGMEDPAHPRDRLFNAGVIHRNGEFRWIAGHAWGTTTRDDRFRSLLLAATWARGASEVKVGWVGGRARKPDGSVRSEHRLMGLGYFHHLSKRTLLYANLAHDAKAKAERRGIDLGLQHNF